MKCILFIIKIFSVIFFSVAMYSCGSPDNKINADVSGIYVNLKVHRFDQALFSLPPDSIPGAIPDLQKNFGDFFNLFCARIINIGDVNSRDFGLLLQKFVSDYNMLIAFEDCRNVFSDNIVTTLSQDLTDGFKHFMYFFKNKTIPEIYLYMGGFNQSIVIDNNILGIGLEKYLGKGNNFYRKLGLASYQAYKMQKEFIVPDCFRAIAWSEFPYNDSTDNLASNMIYQGKVQYFLDIMLPDLADTVKFGFTGKQWEWCINNEQSMWGNLIDNKELFTTVQIDIKRYIDDAPFTSTFPHESPGRTGVWIGWRIVCNYMRLHPEITPEQLMNDNDYQKIMNQSGYNP